MANRVTEAEVRNIMNDMDSAVASATVTACITAANALVTAVCTGLGTALAKEVERWLSAHFVAIGDMKIASQSANGASESYQHAVAIGLNVTMYGQQAIALDTTGGLASVANTGARKTTYLKVLAPDTTD